MLLVFSLDFTKAELLYLYSQPSFFVYLALFVAWVGYLSFLIYRSKLALQDIGWSASAPAPSNSGEAGAGLHGGGSIPLATVAASPTAYGERSSSTGLPMSDELDPPALATSPSLRTPTASSCIPSGTPPIKSISSSDSMKSTCCPSPSSRDRSTPDNLGSSMPISVRAAPPVVSPFGQSSDSDEVALLTNEGSEELSRVPSGAKAAARVAHQVAQQAANTAANAVLSLLKSNPDLATSLRKLAFSYPAMAGAFGSMSVLFAKSVAEIMKEVLRFGGNALTSWPPYIFVTFMLGSLFLQVLPFFSSSSTLLRFLFWLLQVRFLNEGLDKGDALFIVPVYQVFWVLWSTLAGMLYFEDFQVRPAPLFALFGRVILSPSTF